MSEFNTQLPPPEPTNISAKRPRPDASPLHHKKDFHGHLSNVDRSDSSGSTSNSYSSASSSSTSSASSVYSHVDTTVDTDCQSNMIDRSSLPDKARYSINHLPQDILIEIFAWCQHPQFLRLVNKSFHRVSKLTFTKAMWLLRHYPYYKVLEKSLRWTFFDVAVAKAMFQMNHDIFCSRFYVRKAILKLDKEKYRFKSSKKVLQHFVLLTGKKYFGLDPEDDSEFPLQRATGDDRAMTDAIRNRQWSVVEHIGSVNGYGFWVHAPFARSNLNSMLLEARHLVQSIEMPQPTTEPSCMSDSSSVDSLPLSATSSQDTQSQTVSSEVNANLARHQVRTTSILPQSFLRALRTCLCTMSSAYTPYYSNRNSPYTDKYLVKLALQTELISVYSLVLDKLDAYLSTRDKENIVDSMSFEGVTTDETLIRIIRDYKFPIQYGKWNEKPLFALAWVFIISVCVLNASGCD